MAHVHVSTGIGGGEGGGGREIGVTSLAIVGSEDQVISFADPSCGSSGQWDASGPLYIDWTKIGKVSSRNFVFGSLQ